MTAHATRDIKHESGCEMRGRTNARMLARASSKHPGHKPIEYVSLLEH
jgi:hypothetical protein